MRAPERDGFYWARFYAGAPWQPCKIWHESGKQKRRVIKGLDWGDRAPVDGLDSPEWGPRIEQPDGCFDPDLDGWEPNCIDTRAVRAPAASGPGERDG